MTMSIVTSSITSGTKFESSSSASPSPVVGRVVTMSPDPDREEPLALVTWLGVSDCGLVTRGGSGGATGDARGSAPALGRTSGSIITDPFPVSYTHLRAHETV